MISLMLALVALITFVGMEFVARGMHKFVMHGVLWRVHEDHHAEKQRELEKNDLFGLLFAGVSVYLILNGILYGNAMALSVAVGMTAYGLAYFVVHDMIIHDRHILLRSWGMRHDPFRRLIEVHDVHHKEGEGNWGFLFVIRGLDKVPERQAR